MLYISTRLGRRGKAGQGKCKLYSFFPSCSCFVKFKSIDVRLLERERGGQAEAEITGDFISCLIGFTTYRAHVSWRG